jgi:hypothetical protein
MSDFISRADVRKRYKLSTSTLYRAELRGQLNPLHLNKTSVYYAASEVLIYIKNRNGK